jgi:hypothetical protein
MKLISVMAAIAAFALPALPTPVVITGKDLPRLLGKPVPSLRVLGLGGAAIPFQIDEVTPAGEYVLPMGERPNAGEGDGVLGARDEIAFLWDDTGAFSGDRPEIAGDAEIAVLARGGEKRFVAVLADTSVTLSKTRYIDYDHASLRVSTPFYYADFAPRRFHFVKAGVKDFSGGAADYIDLANELRVAIHLRTLFGLVPVRYTENSIVCLVRRYKAGPVRLIRRGDFHLNLGMGVKGSRAAVNQICYPQIVEVPVHVSLPVRFRALFSQAYIEMTPVIRDEGRAFRFTVPSENLAFAAGGPARLDTLHAAAPDGKLFMLRDGNAGYGWLLNTDMERGYLGGSGFVVRRPPSQGRRGAAECGYRLAVRDVPKGNYNIDNRVFFSGGGSGDIERLSEAARRPVKVEAGT